MLLIEDELTTTYNQIARPQALYPLRARLCVTSIYLSIAFIVLVRLNYAVAQRWRRAREIG